MGGTKYWYRELVVVVLAGGGGAAPSASPSAAAALPPGACWRRKGTGARMYREWQDGEQHDIWVTRGHSRKLLRLTAVDMYTCTAISVPYVCRSRMVCPTSCSSMHSVWVNTHTTHLATGNPWRISLPVLRALPCRPAAASPCGSQTCGRTSPSIACSFSTAWHWPCCVPS